MRPQCVHYHPQEPVDATVAAARAAFPTICNLHTKTYSLSSNLPHISRPINRLFELVAAGHLKSTRRGPDKQGLMGGLGLQWSVTCVRIWQCDQVKRSLESGFTAGL